MVAVSVGVGCALWAANVVVLELARAGRLAEAVFWWTLDVSFAVLAGLQLAAAVVVVLRARTAPAGEVRRVVLFGGGFLLSAGLMTAYNVVEAFTPGDWLSNYRWSPAVAVVELLRFPGLVLLWWSVLAVRVPHAREAARAMARRLLGRGGRFGVAAALPAAALVGLVASRPERAVGAVLADPAARSLAAATALLLLVAGGRRWLLARLDAWVYPDTADQRQAMAEAAVALGQADRVATVRRTLRRTVKRACGAPAALLLASDAAGEQAFATAEDGLPPLGAPRRRARAGDGGRGDEGAPGRRDVGLRDAAPGGGCVGGGDRPDVVAPVRGTGTELVGVLVVGLRFDGRVVAAGRRSVPRGAGGGGGTRAGAPPRRRGAGRRVGRRAGGDGVPRLRLRGGGRRVAGVRLRVGVRGNEVPKLLAGKYRLDRRLGGGGMGAVYLRGTCGSSATWR